VLLNWRIVQAPIVVVDCVAAHEAVHLVRRNHTPASWSELVKLVPDVDSRRAELRRRGRELLW
jgi:predicted metal-dependent hydrolase